MTHLSDVFKYISHFRHAGHQVGRKVGDMLEVLTYAALARDPEILARLHIEPKLYGFSGAGHKVEFIVLDQASYDENGEPKIKSGGEIESPEDVIAFIECKRVGVEQTINSKFKRDFKKSGVGKAYNIPYEQSFSISFAQRGQERHTFSLIFSSNGDLEITKLEDKIFRKVVHCADNQRIVFALSTDNEAVVIPNEESLRDFNNSLGKCRILEIETFHQEHLTALLNDCLAGPQTPEKAKQSSFVALDVRKKRFNSFDIRENESEMLSILVLTEFCHWENKSQNMIRSCIDKNVVISDDLIIESFESFEQEFGEDFYDKITKDNLLKDADVRKLAIDLVDKYEGFIFWDIEDQLHKKIILTEDTQIKFIS